MATATATRTVKKAIGLYWQKNNFARAARLLDISRFMEDVNARRQFFFFFSELRFSPLKSTPGKFHNNKQIV